VDEKWDVIYDQKDKILFPRIGHTDQGRPEIHRMWREVLNGSTKGKPNMAYNMQFLLHYQIGWMYVRYFMWNFVGRQTAEQGWFPWDLSKGHWQSGITPIDEAKLYKMDKLPDTMKNDESSNKYYFLPLIFGLLGLVFHFIQKREEFIVLLILFVITGIGIIIYSNQPPNEPRERDYVLVGSFMTFCIWIGMGVLAIYHYLAQKMQGIAPAAIAGVLVLSAPVIMGFQNFDDHSRKHHYASRDYAANFLNSVDRNAIIFTYGDNDTYPLWYAQEVENIRRDVRVVNLSLIAVDWYINKLRYRVNESAPLKLTLTEADYRGKNRNQIFFYDPSGQDISAPINVFEGLRRIKDPQFSYQGQTYINARNFYLPVDREKYLKLGVQTNIDTSEWADNVMFSFPPSSGSFTKDDLAIMDVIASNFYDRPIYFAITCQVNKLLGLDQYIEMDGLGLRISPTKVRRKSQLPAIYGMGDVNEEKVYDNAMNKWKWGNFDKEKTYVDKSFMAEIQAMKLSMLRAAIAFDEKGNFKKSTAIVNKYFEAFPHINFPYDYGIMPFIQLLISGKDFESAKKHMRILANETKQYIEFYESQTDKKVLDSFGQDYQTRMVAAQDLIANSKKVEDPAFEKEMSNMLSQYVKIQEQTPPPN
jgi:hypothetical protein